MPQIKVLNNLLIAFNYSRISLAVLSLTLKQSILIVQGVCSSLRYSIYKVHFRALRSRGEPVYSITGVSVCQQLFSKFMTFLEVFSLRLRTFLKAPEYSTKGITKCQALF